MASPMQSPLSCISYFLTQLNIIANPEHRATDPIGLEWKDLWINSDVIRGGQASPWQVTLEIKQNAPQEQNVPYNFSLVMVGLFQLPAGFQAPNPEEFVRVNGSSFLFGAAREILRVAMSAGPYFPIMLPTVSFFAPAPAAVSEKPTCKERKEKSQSGK